MSMQYDEADRAALHEARKHWSIEDAERAIVDAADKWRSDQRPAAEDALVRAVDAWRKLKGGA